MSLLKTVLLAFVAVSLVNGATSQAFAAARPEVQIKDGRLIGMIRNGSEAFLGIPYAAPPTGALRWKAPQPVHAWSKARDASLFPQMCPQSGRPFGDTTSDRGPAPVMGSEDCLYLNVYRPQRLTRADHLPVMVWIHGGGFTSGSANEYDGSSIAERQRVIVVAMNYRLGALGFLAHPELSAERGGGSGSGNYALLDQQFALQWVRKNIAAFGGDPGNVTIFGESAGGASVCSHLVSPGASGLFHKAIIESGLCTYPKKQSPLAEAEKAGEAFATELHCAAGSSIDCLRGKTVEEIVNAPTVAIGIEGKGSWGTIYGDEVLPVWETDAFASGKFNRVPVISGSNSQEGRLFAWLFAMRGVSLPPQAYPMVVQQTFGAQADAVLARYPLTNFENPYYAMASWITDSTFSCPALTTSTLLATHVPTFVYEFSDSQAPNRLPSRAELPSLGAFHASEVTYIFQRLWPLADPARFNANQKVLADVMQTYWANFAKTGNPNEKSLPVWVSHSQSGVIQDLNPAGVTAVVDYAKAHQCEFWNH